jgi:hypothetical protein
MLLQSSGLKINQARKPHEASADCFTLVSCLAYSSILTMKVTCYTETTLRDVTEDKTPESMATDEYFG